MLWSICSRSVFSDQYHCTSAVWLLLAFLDFLAQISDQQRVYSSCSLNQDKGSLSPALKCLKMPSPRKMLCISCVSCVSPSPRNMLCISCLNPGSPRPSIHLSHFSALYVLYILTKCPEHPHSTLGQNSSVHGTKRPCLPKAAAWEDAVSAGWM